MPQSTVYRLVNEGYFEKVMFELIIEQTERGSHLEILEKNVFTQDNSKSEADKQAWKCVKFGYFVL